MSRHHPNFFVIGVVKGGTTSLHNYLDQHPEIYMSPIKETNFFSREDIDPARFTKAYSHDVNVDIRKYLASGMTEKIHIAHVTSEADYLALYRNVKDEKAIGEASNSYILYPHAPLRIQQAYPGARIIAMLRNPVERAYSQYIMNIRLGKTLETDFIHELREDERRLPQGWGASHQYLSIGKYHMQVRRYLETFPPEQVLICWYEEYQEDPGGVLRQIYRFLGVDENFSPDTSEKLNVAGIPKLSRLNYWMNQLGLISWAKRKLPRSWRKPFKQWMYSSRTDDIPAMTPQEREWLIDYYREDVMALSALLGKDLSHWLQ